MKRSTLTAIAFTLATIGMASPALAAGGGNGGGSGSGAGGGGAAGGVALAGPSIGAIRATSAVASCSAGSTMTVALNKGFQKRVEMQVAAVGTALPSGNTSLGGTWEIHLTNDTTAKPVTGFATSLVGQTPSVLWTILGSTVPTGVSNLSFTAVRRDSGSTLSLNPPMTPVLETCTAQLTVLAN